MADHYDKRMVQYTVSEMVSPWYGIQKHKGHLCKLEMQHMFKKPGISPNFISYTTEAEYYTIHN